jgi:superfamily II DNA or RNA helicase
MQVEISDRLYLSGGPEALQSEIKSRLTFPNPKWEANEKMGRWQGDTPRLLKCYEVGQDGSLVIPRGFIDRLVSICRNHGEPFDIEDRRRILSEVDFTFTGRLRPYQKEAVKAILERNSGTLDAPTGSGKTVIAAAVIAERRQPALIVVHSKELLHQWVDRIGQFLGIPAAEVGIIGGGRKQTGERITVALVQSLYKCAEEVAPHIGHLVVDECHRCPSRTFTEAVTAFDCQYVLGLSATPWRRDRLSRLIFWYLGNVCHEVDPAQLVDEGALVEVEIVLRETGFRTEFDASAEYSKMLSELTEDEARNRLIASDIAVDALNGGGICLCLSDRKHHCLALQDILTQDFGQPCEVLTGDLTAAQRKAIVERLNAGDIKVLIATGQLIGEGFDCREFSTLFLATPVRFSGRVLQYLGRVLRPAPGKDRARVYDYLDKHVGPLVASFKARQRVLCRG